MLLHHDRMIEWDIKIILYALAANTYTFLKSQKFHRNVCLFLLADCDDLKRLNICGIGKRKR